MTKFNIPDFGAWFNRIIYVGIIIISAFVVFFSLKSCEGEEPNRIEKQIQELLLNQEKFKTSILILTNENQKLQEDIKTAKQETTSNENKLIQETELQKKELENRKAELLKIKKLINE